MQTTPNDRKYTKTHEWVKIEGGVAVIGITDHAQKQLGDITFVELPAVGSAVGQGDSFGVIESVKAASDLVAPVGGEVSEINRVLESKPELVNQSPYADGWMIKLTKLDAAQTAPLLTAAEYDAAAANDG
jgi:glycine cleavage system H protein